MSLKDYYGRIGRQSLFVQEYTFTIKYLPGSDNFAADIASRPTKVALAVTTRSTAQREDIIATEKDISKIDQYDDLPLVYRLKNGKHLPGLSKNQVNRINRSLDNYRMKDDAIFIIRNGMWKEIPFKEHRKNLIESSHYLGHFSTETTLYRLAKNYYWKKMSTDVENFIDRCLTCQRFKSAPALEHPAKAIPINHHFEIIP